MKLKSYINCNALTILTLRQKLIHTPTNSFKSESSKESFFRMLKHRRIFMGRRTTGGNVYLIFWKHRYEVYTRIIENFKLTFGSMTRRMPLPHISPGGLTIQILPGLLFIW